jgi:small-conductance mechanosensitive channel
LFRRFNSVAAIIAIFCLALACSVRLSAAQGSTNSPDAARPAKIQLMLDLLDDEDVQKWIKEQRAAKPAEAAKPRYVNPGLVVSSRLANVRRHLTEIVAAVPKIPSEFGRAMQKLSDEGGGYGPAGLALIVAGLLAVGLGAATLFNRFVAAGRAGSAAFLLGPPEERFRQLLKRLLFSAGSTATFGVASIGLLQLFNWPGLVRDIIVMLLLAGLTTWAVWSVLSVLLAPAADPIVPPGAIQRPVPLATPQADHFRLWLTLATGWFVFGYAMVHIVRLLGMDFRVSQIIAYTLGIGLLAIGLYTLSRRPGQPSASADLTATASTSMLGVGFVGLWLLWATGAALMFWLLLVVLALPIALKWSRLTLRQMFEVSPSAMDFESTSSAAAAEAPPSLWWAVVDQAARAVLIFGAIALLLWGWGVEPEALSSNQDVYSKLARAALKILAIVMIANLAWQLVRTVIDSYLASMPDLGDAGLKETVRQAKLRTLLPIIRNGSMVFIFTLTVMMSLSAIGIEIGPLIASAGVVGVAIGFGAQTLVKDVISGMFYLLDDAFRIGEYIVAGNYKGTVESFSLRSVRLRHHRGPIYTIPFGDLGAVQNLSRDFVIDKLRFQVTYDTDLEKARKLIKKAGQELAADPEFGSKIIEPLKMQRVENFGEYGIEIATKMTCVPGGQWEVRKKIYPMIKKLFEENGIEFARPTVNVAGGDAGASAVAAGSVTARKTRARKKAGG